MAYIDWWNRTGPSTLGERFGLNEISTRAKTLSPTKSYASKLGTEYEDIITIDDYDKWKTNTKILEDFEITDEMRRRPNVEGGRIDLKPGGIVEPGVEYYANPEGRPDIKIKDWTSEQKANLKTWMKNTGSTLEDFYKKSNDEKFRIKRGHSLGVLQAEEPKKLANIKAWEKNTGLKFKDVKDQNKKWRIRGGHTTGVQVGKLTEAEKAANIKAWEKYTGLKYKDLNKERQSGVRLGKTKGTRELMTASQSLEKSIWLKDYTFADLTKDLKAGKTHTQIADKLYEKNPEFFENLQKTRKVKDPNPINSLRTALWGRIGKKEELVRLNKLNEKNFLAREKVALKDVRKFIEKNQDAYKKVYASNKIGAVSNFKEKVLDFISKKYPEFITRSKGGQSILSGQRVFTPYRLTERSGQGNYSLDVGLKKDIRKALNIPERPGAGEGMTIPRLQRNYNKNLLSLIKVARDKNIIPKSINSESKYVSYIKKTQSDPIRNLFGKKFNFGQEHLGGVSRAVAVNDAQSLAKITAIDPVVNQWVKGPQYDKKISSLMKLAKQSSGETAKGYIDSVNKLLAESDAKFGLNQTKYKIVKDEIIPIQPKGALEDSLYKKAQRALKTFVATKRFKDPKFKLLPEELKKAINFLKEGDVLKSNAFLKAAIKRGGAASVVLLGTGMALNTLTDPAEAQTLEPVDKTQEASVLPSVISEHPILSSAAAVTAAAPKKVWEGVKWGAKKLIPIMTPAGSHVLHGGKYDLTSGQDLSTMAFWKHATDWMGARSRWGNKMIGLKKRLRDIAWRGGLPTRFLPLISGTASVAAGPMLIKDAAEWLQGRLEKDNLTGKGGIADYAGIIPDEAGGSLFIEDVVKEKQKQAAEGMDYAQGGIASLIK